MFDDATDGGNGTGVSFRRFSADGTANDLTDRVAVDIAGSQFSNIGAIDFLASGEAVITYNSSSNVFAQRFLQNGNATGAASDVSSTANTENQSAVAALSGGGFAVVFNDQTADVIRLRLFDFAGVATGAAVTVSDASANHFNPQVEGLANGGFVVTWQDGSQTPPDTDNFAIRAQLFDSAGAEVGSEFTVNTLIEGLQGGPSVQALADGGFAIFYSSNGEIRGQIFDAFGARVGTEFLVNTTTFGGQQAPEVALLADGRIVVTWGDQSGTGPDGFAFNIFMQIIDPRDGVVTGSDGSETLFGHENLSDEINGLDGNDTMFGLNGSDSLYGGVGGDTLDGGAGDDLLFGGFGNDTFVLGSGNDAVQDDGGADTITSTISRSLASFAAIEHLTLLGTAAINGTGNDLVNTITGNSGNNVLDGGLSTDVLIGGAGDDTYVLADGTDVISDTGGIDTITSTITRSIDSFTTVENLTLIGGNLNGTGNGLANLIIGTTGVNVLSGGSGNDRLIALNGNDRLDGGLGNDRLEGGSGNDTYVINSTSDVPVESSGIDLVTSTVTYTLKSGFEKLMLTSGNIGGTGNSSANTIIGSTGANKLLGMNGNDSLNGGSGNDILTGGFGRDIMIGSTGFDDFDFNSISESRVGSTRDVINSFQRGIDDIDLRTIDARSGVSGNQAFTFIGTQDFNDVRGELRYRDLGSTCIVQGDVNGDGRADFEITVKATSLAGGDFLL
ncbi:MAG: calcium-binding protein [Xanthobacteraceae bacterium]